MSDVGPIEYFVCGGFGGICTVLVGHPFDTIKVRLQTMPLPKPGEKPVYTGAFDCFKKTIKNEGPKGLYKGMGTPLVTISPIFAISFMGYKLGKILFGPKDPNKFRYIDYFNAGAFSAVLTTTIMAPGERIKCLLQIQADSNVKKYDGPLDALRKTYKEGGIRNIYTGTLATLLRDVPLSGLYFLTYEAIQDNLTEHKTKPMSLGGTILAGGCAGISCWLVGMPSDVLKSRIQTALPGQNKAVLHVALHLIKTEGPFALYKGILPVLLRAFPANAACFVGFELLKTTIRKFTD